MFLPYIRDYVKTFSGKSIDTFQWKDHLYSYYKAHGGQEKIDALDSIDWNVSENESVVIFKAYLQSRLGSTVKASNFQ